MKLLIKLLLLSSFIWLSSSSIATELKETSLIIHEKIKLKRQELRAKLDLFYRQNLTENSDSLMKVANIIPDDVMPDIEDQDIDAQRIFIIYFLKYSKDMNEEQKIDFGWDLSDSLILFKRVPKKTVKSFEELHAHYGFDFSQVVNYCQQMAIILSVEDELREKKINLAIEEGKRLDAEGKRLDAEGKRLDRELEEILRRRKAIEEFFKLLGKKDNKE